MLPAFSTVFAVLFMFVILPVVIARLIMGPCTVCDPDEERTRANPAASSVTDADEFERELTELEAKAKRVSDPWSGSEY